MARSTTRWTIKPETFGDSLDSVCRTRLPRWDVIARLLKLPSAISKPPLYCEESLIDDFSVDFDASGCSLLKIYPFSALDDILLDGDLVVFMTRSSNLSKPEDIAKMRGWHGEIVFLESLKRRSRLF